MLKLCIMGAVKSVWRLFQKTENPVYVKYHIETVKIPYPHQDVLFVDVEGIIIIHRCNPADV